uniref:Pyrroline-5-carboxylate reductase n=1 Tax=Rhabditophanes sp. KR3021 TaxID=114890 RepID=A0AC35UH67_9BILA
MVNTRIGFIGAGKMAQALAKGLVTSGRYAAENITASCPKKDIKMLEECKVLGINTTFDNSEVVHNSDVVFIAVKPNYVSQVASEIAPVFERNHLLVSIALGITIRNIENLLPTKSRVVRVIPNTPCLVGAGASAYSMGSACYDGDSSLVHDLLSTVGYAVEVNETLINPTTSVASSGVAFMLAVIEGLADGGVKMGMPRDLAIKLAATTMFGASKMVLETDEHPAILKDAVQSPGGSSIFGMHELEKGNLKGIIISAVEAACNRSEAVGKQFSNH